MNNNTVYTAKDQYKAAYELFRLRKRNNFNTANPLLKGLRRGNLYLIIARIDVDIYYAAVQSWEDSWYNF